MSLSYIFTLLLSSSLSTTTTTTIGVSKTNSNDHNNNNNNNNHTYIVCYKPALTLCSLNSDIDRSNRKNRQERLTIANLSIPLLHSKIDDDNDDVRRIGSDIVQSDDTADHDRTQQQQQHQEKKQQQQQQLHLVGRLDRDSEGLLLLTNDGQFTSNVLSSHNCHKTYWALVDGGIPTTDAIKQMKYGTLNIRGKITRPPISVRIIPSNEIQQKHLPSPLFGMGETTTTTTKKKNRSNSSSSSCWLEIVLNEGKNRQIRKITKHAGHKTIRLVRVGIGNLILNTNTNTDDSNNNNNDEVSVVSLQPGEWEYIKPNQVLGEKEEKKKS